MAQLDALKLTNAVKNRILEFALQDHFVRDGEVRNACRTIWGGPPEEGGLASDLWVEAAFPAKAGDRTLNDLVQEGKFDVDLSNLLNRSGHFPSDRFPYTHQLESLEAARKGYAAAQGEKPAIVVSAGTGAGKTESFLLPLLNDLQRNRPAPDGGVSCIILYPMNALVNDQVDRLYNWLIDQNQITLFHFTSETPENTRAANAQKVPAWEPCRFRTRQEARRIEPHPSGAVPQILITNYSMLEYMLCRPQDAGFFGPNLRTLVLDEAHLYTGNLAAEITLLQRRIYERCGVDAGDVIQFATSATIGSGSRSEQETLLRDFASRLFSKPLDRIQVFFGQPHHEQIDEGSHTNAKADDIAPQPWPEEATLEQRADQISFVDCTNAEWQNWKTSLCSICDPSLVEENFAVSDRKVAPALYRVLKNCKMLAQTQQLLREKKQLPLRELAARLFGAAGSNELEATRRLLQIGAVARPAVSAHPLLPNRVHYLVRPPEGLSISFCPDRKPPNAPTLKGKAYIFSNAREPFSSSQDSSLPLTLSRCRESGEWFIAGVRSQRGDGTYLEEVPQKIGRGWGHDDEEDAVVRRSVEFYLLEEPVGIHSEHSVYDYHTGKLGGRGDPGIDLWKIEESPRTGNQLIESARYFGSLGRLQLALLAETALMEMPMLASKHNLWLPARGRRLLIFSDSRSEAARLGPRFTRQHELFVVRSAIVEAVLRMPLADGEVISYVGNRITELKEQIASVEPGGALHQRLSKELADQGKLLQDLQAGGTVKDWCNQLAAVPRMAELFHFETEKEHVAEDWIEEHGWKSNHNRICSEKNIQSLLGRELARRPRWPQIGLETLGIVEVTYPSLERLVTSGPELNDLLGGVGFTNVMRTGLKEVWTELLATVCDEIRSMGCVTLGTKEADDTFQYGRVLVGKWLSLEFGSKNSKIYPLYSSSGRSKIHKYIHAVLARIESGREVRKELVDDVIRAIWNQLLRAAQDGDNFAWLEYEVHPAGNDVADTVRIKFPELGLRRPRTLYQCRFSGQVWPRSVLNCCPGADRSELAKSDAETLDNDPRLGWLRRELRESAIFQNGLWAQEHSAQLNPQENLRIQELFKAGIRNVLSSTTTLELGIDIGGLQGVMMGNVPPGKANYLQRAGRAGRRADGSSIVLAFARPTPYEREVFLHFGNYLDQPLRQPTVFLGRSSIAIRHGAALLLGEFFRQIFDANERRGAMDAFGRMGQFCGIPKIGYWRKNEAKPPPVRDHHNWTIPEEPWTPANRQDLSIDQLFLAYLRWQKANPGIMSMALERLWRDTPLQGNTEEALSKILEHFESAIGLWRQDFDTLIEAWDAIDPHDDIRYAAANSLYYQIKAFRQLTVIEGLADSQFLPRYGFPIGLSRLSVKVPGIDEPGDKPREEDQFRLQRDSMMALREYVPGSQLLAGGKLITSRGLLKHWTGEPSDEAIGFRGWYVRGPEGEFDFSLTGPPNKPQGWTQGQFCLPRYGFTSAAWDPPKLSDDFERIGQIETFSTAFSENHELLVSIEKFGGIDRLSAHLRPGGEIILMNNGSGGRGFAICHKCGFSESESEFGSGREELPRYYEFHASLFSSDPDTYCWRKNQAAPVLRNQALAAKQVTNLLMLDFSPWLRKRNLLHRCIALTLAQVLRIAACKILQLDLREIRSLDSIPSVSDPEVGQCVVLFDSLAGGAGHVDALANPKDRHREWLLVALDHLRVDGPVSEAERRRTMLSRILTADSPDGTGEVDYAPVETFEFLRDLLEGDSNGNWSGDGGAEPTPPTKPSGPTEEQRRNILERQEKAKARRSSTRKRNQLNLDGTLNAEGITKRLLSVKRSDPMSISFGNQAFLSMGGLGFLAAEAIDRTSKGVEFEISGDSGPLDYLARLDFFKSIGQQRAEGFKRHNEAGRFIPIRLIETERDAFKAADAVCDLVLHQFTNQREFLPALEWAIAEIVDNIQLHAASATPGVLVGQHYPEKQRIEFGIVDNGRGLMGSLSETFSLATHVEAIAKALERGVTRDKKIGQGNGLAGSLEIIQCNKGTLQLISGDAIFECSPRYPEGEIRSLECSWPGTGIFLSLNTANPVDLNDTFLGERGWSYIDSECERISDSGVKIAEECLHTRGRAPATGLRRKIEALLPDFEGELQFDFSDVRFASSSFLDELLGRLALSLGEEGFRKKVRVANASPQIVDLANVVIKQRLDD